MKRGGPLRRRKALQAHTTLKRGGKLAPTSKRKRAERVALAARDTSLQALAWRLSAVSLGTCACCGKPPTDADPLEAHHVLPQQYIKRYVHGLALAPGEAANLLAELLWDRRNSMPLRRQHHAMHTNGKRRVPWAALTTQHKEFAAALSMEYVLARQYPREA